MTPVEQIVELGHRYGARVLIDGAQSIPHIPVDVTKTGADFFVFSEHKIFGPTGIGALALRHRGMAEPRAVAARRQHDRRRHPGAGDHPGTAQQVRGRHRQHRRCRRTRRGAALCGEEGRLERIAAYEHALLGYATPKNARLLLIKPHIKLA